MKQVTLHITEVLGDERFEEVHLCEDCAKKYLQQPQNNKDAKAHLAGENEEDPPSNAMCAACGMTFLEFRNHGRFGCAHDYDAFKRELTTLMENIHENTRHTGKTPRRAPRSQTIQAELAQLREQLQSLVHDEQYEQAARIRDRIKDLETPQSVSNDD
jgi:protein arginine kinase activator